MGDGIRGHVDSALQRADREYGGNKGFITLWDMSDSPDTNDRLRKLGKSFDLTRGGAIDTFDEGTLMERLWT